jgi:UDP-N-acetylmuramyl tripeptide synthase
LTVHQFLPEGSEGWCDGELLRFGPHTLPLSEVPIAIGGAAPHNVENALCAGLAGLAAGLPWEVVAGGLRSLTLSPEDSRGRTNLFVREGATYVVDFAHNPAGLRHMAVLSARWPAQRRILLLGQSGDRTNELIEALTAEALRLLPDLILLKELPAHLRGRRKGEVPALIRAALARAGSAVPVVEVEDEVEGTREALRRHQPGDLCFLFVHEEYDRVVGLLRDSGARPLQGG